MADVLLCLREWIKESYRRTLCRVSTPTDKHIHFIKTIVKISYEINKDLIDYTVALENIIDSFRNAQAAGNHNVTAALGAISTLSINTARYYRIIELLKRLNGYTLKNYVC